MARKDTEHEPFLGSEETAQSDQFINSRAKRTHFIKLNGILCVFQLTLLLLNLALLSNGSTWIKDRLVSVDDDSIFEIAYCKFCFLSLAYWP
jgi:hypothetical protein